MAVFDKCNLINKLKMECPELYKVWEYFWLSGNEMQGDVALLNWLAIGSRVNLKVPIGRSLSLMNIAPAGVGKTIILDKIYTIMTGHSPIPNEVPALGTQDIVYLGDDITMNYIIKHYRKGELLTNRTAFLSDLTTCLTAKNTRGENRFGAFWSNMLTDGRYGYGDMPNEAEDMVFIARMNLITNIVYSHFKREFLDKSTKSTLIQRFGLVFYTLSDDEQFSLKRKIVKQEFRDVKIPKIKLINSKKIKLTYNEVAEYITEYLDKNRFEINRELESRARHIDKCIALMCGVLAYEPIDNVKKLPIYLIDLFMGYSKDILSTASQVEVLLEAKRSVPEIAEILNMTERHIYRVKSHIESGEYNLNIYKSNKFESR